MHLKSTYILLLFTAIVYFYDEMKYPAQYHILGWGKSAWIFLVYHSWIRIRWQRGRRKRGCIWRYKRSSLRPFAELVFCARLLVYNYLFASIFHNYSSFVMKVNLFLKSYFIIGDDFLPVIYVYPGILQFHFPTRFLILGFHLFISSSFKDNNLELFENSLENQRKIIGKGCWSQEMFDHLIFIIKR